MTQSKTVIRDSPWDESGYAKDVKKLYHRDGWCEDFKVFKKHWDRLPKAKFLLHIRNFNKLSDCGTIQMAVKTTIMGVRLDRLYYHHPNLADFFPVDLVRFLAEEERNNKKSLTAPFLVKIGDLIARATGREFSITHQEGGDPEYAAFTNYGPFYPDKFTSFDFNPKDTWGFLSLEDGSFAEHDVFGE